MRRKKILVFSCILLMLPALWCCNPYQKLLKSKDHALKYKKAVEYFDKGDYARAVPLLESLPEVFGPNEDIQYKLAYSYYKQGMFQLASYQFKNFAETFPLSTKNEEAYYLYAFCLYKDSPKEDLDQRSTEDAVNAFQLFINKYPESKWVENSNTYIDELYGKLERKSIDNALIYYKIEDYKSAVWAIRNVLNEYPATKDREKLEFYIIRSSYKLATKSVERKQKERFTDTIQYYNEFRERFPSSRFDQEIKKIIDDTNHSLEKLK